MDMPKKLLLVLLVVLMLPFDGTFGFGLDRREAKDEAESPNITHCFFQQAQIIIPTDGVYYLHPTKKHLIAIAHVGDILSRKYSIRNLNPLTLEEVWEITDLDRFSIEISEKYIVIGANTTGFLKLIDIDNGNVLLDVNLGEDITSLEFVESYLFVTTPTRILLYDEFHRFIKEMKNDKFWVGKNLHNYLFLGNRDKGLKCIDYKTGELKWFCNFKIQYGWGVYLIEGKIISATKDNELVAIDKTTGKFIWKVKYDKKEIGTNNISQIIIDNKLFFTDRIDPYDETTDYIACINLNNGELLWKRNDLNIDYFHSLHTYNNNLYAMNDSFLYSLDKNNGNVLLKTNLLHKIWYFVFIPLTGCVATILDQSYEIKDSKLCLYKQIIPEFLTYSLDKTVFSTLNVDYYMDVKPSIVNGSTYMPAKYLLEPLGGEVNWIQKDKKVTCILKNDTKDITIEMQINNPKATLNGKQVQIDPKNPKITPIIINGRTMVPLRFLAESLGCKVEWKPDTKEIVVTYQP